MQPLDVRVIFRASTGVRWTLKIISISFAATRRGSWGRRLRRSLLSTVVACLWPDTYVSTGIIRVVPPQVPESYVPTNINSQMSQRVNSMYQTISSRGNLTNIINLYDLYRRDRSRKPMEDIVEQMRRDIKISNVVPLSQGERQISAFQISFSYENRIVAQKVTADLVSRFMTENTRERTTQSVLTTQFLKDQLENAKKELDTIEAKADEFPHDAQTAGCPDQVQQNATQMAMLEQRISNLNAALGRISQDKMLLEADLRSAKSQRAALTPTSENVVRKQKNDGLSRSIARSCSWKLRCHNAAPAL